MAATDQLTDLGARATARPDVVTIGLTETARRARDYPSYVAALAATAPEEVRFAALILVGPRNRVTALTKRLALLGAGEVSAAAG